MNAHGGSSTATPSTVTPSETPSTKRTSTQSRRKRIRRAVTPHSNYDDHFATLSDAMDQAREDLSDGEEVDVVLLPPVNTCDGDTDNELGNDNSLISVTLDCVAEVAGTLEVQSSQKTSRTSKPKKEVILSYHQTIKL